MHCAINSSACAELLSSPALPMDLHVNTHGALITRCLSATFSFTKSNSFVIQPRLQLCLLCSAREFPVLIRQISLTFNSFLVSTRHCEDLQHVRRAFINVDHLISQDFNDQVIGVWDRDILWCCAQAPHLASAPCLSFSSFCAPLDISTSTIVLECW